MAVNDNYRLIGQCRLCDSSNLERYFNFGNVPLGNNLAPSLDDALIADRYPLSVNRCVACGHFQLTVAVSPRKLYATNYTYLSGIGKSFLLHFQEYAAWVQEYCNLQPDALVVDVGSNDGTCLKEFKKLGLKICGVDPASVPAKLANEAGIPTLNLFFDEAAVDEIITTHGKADFVTSHNVLAHVDDLGAVFRNIYRLLKNGGHFCFEIGYFRQVLKTGCFDTIYHEHLDYHHAKPLAQLLCGLGFDLLDLRENQIQGGSLRLFLQKTGDGVIYSGAKQFIDEEAQSILYQTDALLKWPSRIKENMIKFRETVKKYVAAGKIVAGYGAPTKATLLMDMSELGYSDISFIVEDNLLKVDRFMPGTGVPILDVAELQLRKPDIIVVFAWNFCDDIIFKLKAHVDWPIKFLVPLPDFLEENW
ncbi:class I SAM-dependent methyltransferase [Alphaproteobacteria bacterium]|nr:class I SAM-dependent methyltransferase [Alphaproteobacteria bacterium]MDC1085856.1 class I SAM-dependent methyltransferase [Alphaproteobacteria bacterium]